MPFNTDLPLLIQIVNEHLLHSPLVKQQLPKSWHSLRAWLISLAPFNDPFFLIKSLGPVRYKVIDWILYRKDYPLTLIKVRHPVSISGRQYQNCQESPESDYGVHQHALFGFDLPFGQLLESTCCTGLPNMQPWALLALLPRLISQHMKCLVPLSATTPQIRGNE